METYSYKYPRPAVTTDCIIFGFTGEKLQVLLIERGIEPFKGKWALPGGFLKENETTDECAARELYEETNLKNIFIEQLYTFSVTNRDPRGRVISVAYYALVHSDKFKPTAGDDAQKAQWFNIDNLPELAFDHQHIYQVAVNRLKGKIRYQPIGFELLPEKFTLTELQQLYEAVLEQKLDKRNFRKKILKMNILIELDEKQKNVAHKAARLYRFDNDKYIKLSRSGFNFEI